MLIKLRKVKKDELLERKLKREKERLNKEKNEVPLLKEEFSEDDDNMPSLEWLKLIF